VEKGKVKGKRKKGKGERKGSAKGNMNLPTTEPKVRGIAYFTV
jgi:hypothetical protein